MFGLKKPIPKPESPIIGQCYQGKDGKKLGKYIGDQVKSEFFKGHIADGDDTEYKTNYLIFSDNGKINEVPASDYVYYNDRVVPCSSGGRRRMRKTRKGGSGELVPLTKERLREILQHLGRAQGIGELKNVISDISEIRTLYPDFFTGSAKLASDMLDDINQHEYEAEHFDELRGDLGHLMSILMEKAAERGGRRRGRTTRKKSLRQRK